jgi:hypothetical protein
VKGRDILSHPAFKSEHSYHQLNRIERVDELTSITALISTTEMERLVDIAQEMDKESK